MRGRADDAGPNEPVYDLSDLVDGVLGLLEDAGVPTEINDQIVKLIEAWERGQRTCEHGVIEGDYCEVCRKAYMEAERDFLADNPGE